MERMDGRQVADVMVWCVVSALLALSILSIAAIGYGLPVADASVLSVVFGLMAVDTYRRAA